jgi:hypothetical protein
MPIDIDMLSDQLARDPSFSDYDFWKALQQIDNDLFALQRGGRPLPFKLLQQRRILRDARRKRYGVSG